MPAILVDTNVLLRGTEPLHPQHAAARDSVVVLQRNGETPCLVAQNIIEFRAVCTRPTAVNGLGYSESEANAEVHRLKQLFTIYPDHAAILAHWERLVTRYGAAGKQNHDARLVASMVVYGIDKILTFNKSDFERYSEISVITPSEALRLDTP